MKRTGTCPKCSGKRIYHSPRIMDRSDGNIALALAIARNDPIRAEDVGLFEVYVCRDCGFAELHIRDPHRLDEIVHDAEEHDPLLGAPKPATTRGRHRRAQRGQPAPADDAGDPTSEG